MNKGLLGRLLLTGLLAMPGLLLAQGVVTGTEPAVAQGEVMGFPSPLLLPAFSLLEVAAVPWLQQLQDAAQRHGVDAHLLQALVRVESNFNPMAVSRSGAVGLMQIMPQTAARVAGLRGPTKSLRQQLQDPATNLHAGALYVRYLMDRYDNQLDLVLAAYNAGTGNVLKAGNRVPANGVTPHFVQKVTAFYANIQAAAGISDSLAAELPTPSFTPPATAAQ